MAVQSVRVENSPGGHDSELYKSLGQQQLGYILNNSERKFRVQHGLLSDFVGVCSGSFVSIRKLPYLEVLIRTVSPSSIK